MGIEGTRQRQPKSTFLVFIGVLGKTRLSPVQKPVKYSCRQETDNLVYRGVRVLDNGREHARTSNKVNGFDKTAAKSRQTRGCFPD